MPATHRGTIERIRREDPETGIPVLQVTSFPLTHWLAGCTGDAITPDGKTFLLFENSTAARNASRNLYRVDSDGSGLLLLAEDAVAAVVGIDAQFAYTCRGSALLRVSLEGGDEEEVVRLPKYAQVHVSARSHDGRLLFGQGKRPDGAFDVLRFDLASGAVHPVCRASYVMPVQVHGKDGNRLLASILPIDGNGKPRMPWGYWSFTFSGDEFRKIPFTRSTNHYIALGSSDKVVTTTNHPASALDVASPGDEEARVLAHGAGFWHVTADASGEWVVADTNWPDTGLQLVHAPSGRFRTLCRTSASGGHPQWTHAHPCLAPNAEYVLFTSDRTGYQHLYLCPIPHLFKDELLRIA